MVLLESYYPECSRHERALDARKVDRWILIGFYTLRISWGPLKWKTNDSQYRECWIQAESVTGIFIKQTIMVYDSRPANLNYFQRKVFLDAIINYCLYIYFPLIYIPCCSPKCQYPAVIYQTKPLFMIISYTFTVKFS